MHDIYHEAIAAGGIELQHQIVIEECLELALSLLHLKRGKATIEDVAEEVADVEIMCQQLRCMMGNEIVDKFKKEKLEKLRKRIDENNMVNSLKKEEL